MDQAKQNTLGLVGSPGRLRRICDQINNIEGALMSDDEARHAHGLLRMKIEQAHQCVVDMLLALEARGKPDANEMCLLERLREAGLAGPLGSVPQHRKS